jgi:hypothetical protein
MAGPMCTSERRRRSLGGAKGPGGASAHAVSDVPRTLRKPPCHYAEFLHAPYAGLTARTNSPILIQKIRCSPGSPPTFRGFFFWPPKLAAASAGLTIVKACQDRSNRGNFNKVLFSRSLQVGAMAGETDKSRRYLRWGVANEERAASASDEELKTLFLRIAAQYRDLAEQIDDPEQWRAKRRGRQN